MHTDFPRALYEIGEDRDNRVLVLTDTGDRFMTDIDAAVVIAAETTVFSDFPHLTFAIVMDAQDFSPLSVRPCTKQR
jgi:hypothetical protein